MKNCPAAFAAGQIILVITMNGTTLLIRAYYETLYEFLVCNKSDLTEKIKNLLAEEIKELQPADFNDEKIDAYFQAVVAFLDERIETYNPIGIQYTFDRTATKMAQQLELQLNFYDSTEEFHTLAETANQLAEPDMSDQRLRELTSRLIKQAGAFPDKSIISAYQTAPALQKLPDYILAKTIEETINPQ